ncbi:flavodoxin [Tritrichomonas foetus]|uniref:Flavodoxin n=1 Tax=Tritrichomonas foetus TaxID=1144522 RepID=A0A1J4KYP1_9EUKA|nr:flavodoxin [Tritrichomonas foetus]|eukprot:OHT15992.1 flavodoxin [Tritrichomonas foetus]
MSKSLVVFYSRAGENWFGGSIKNTPVGNTKVVAQTLQLILNCDIAEITSSREYPFNYHKCTEEAKEDLHKKLRPEIQFSADLSQYDTIYLGYPCWWGTAPMPVFTFLENNDFTGKRIAPFCTHEGSGMGESEGDVKRSAKGATVLKGLPVTGSSCSSCESKLQNWVKNH